MKAGNAATISAAFAACFGPAFAETDDRPSAAIESCDGSICEFDQGWSREDREFWYSTSQGSRLIPVSWFLALEEAGSSAKFARDENIERFGYLLSGKSVWNEHGLPIGFVADTQKRTRAKVMCETFPRMCRERVMEEAWVGMTCAACHTNDLTYKGRRFRIEGAPTLADFESFLNELTAALDAAFRRDEKFLRFAEAVLGADAAAAKKSTLRAQLGELLAWRKKLEAKNSSDIKYGYGRLDAQGYIINKVVAVSGAADQSDEIPPDAPASYPYIWNTSQQQKIQWNGVAENLRFDQGDRAAAADYGALTRNTSEVIGVFAHIQTEKNPWWRQFPLPPKSYRSSVQIENLDMLERRLTRLEPPRWPSEIFGEPKFVIGTADGAALYKEHCANCHAPLASDDLKTALPAIYSDSEAITSKAFVRMSRLQEIGTDPLLACNTFLHESETGNFGGRKDRWFQGKNINKKGERDRTHLMIANAAIGAIVHNADAVVKQRLADIFTPVRGRKSDFELTARDNLLIGVKDEATRDRIKRCLDEALSEEGDADPKDDIRAYKARPLTGIWATAPYLHNGSVPTLYDLLQPSTLRVVGKPPIALGAETRPDSFFVGAREFDPAKVGFVTTETAHSSRVTVRNADGEPLPGNYNSGHEYGIGLSSVEKRALIEYLKTL